MDYRSLGRSGLKVSPICLGTMMFGNQTDTAEADRMVGMARERGVNFIDTADVYSRGRSESIVGGLISTDRDRWVLASKVGNLMGDGPNEGGVSRKWILQAIDETLRRLDTDYVDIYYLHRDFQKVPLEETLSAIEDILRQGKARYFGVSNYRGWRIAELVGLCRAHDMPEPVVCQPYYNAMNRLPEVELLPACHHYGLGVVPYSPLARGVLTGKYLPMTEPPEGTRAGRGDKRIHETEFRAESLDMAQKIKVHAENRGLSAGQFALNWVLNNRLVTAVIAGPRTLAQWTENLGSLDHEFSAEDEALIDSLVATGHPSTPGYNDPSYPLVGRVPRTGA